MSRRIVPGSAPSGFSLMYYALCLMMLILVGLFIVPRFMGGSLGLDGLMNFLKFSVYGLVLSKVLFVIGGFMCVGVASQSSLGFLHYISLGVWTISAIIDLVQVLDVELLFNTPAWVETSRNIGGLLAIVASLFFLRNLAEEINSKELITRSKNTLQIGIFTIVAVVAVRAMIMAGINLGEIYPILGFGLLVAMIISFVMYANLLMATGRELDRPQRAPEME